LRSVPKVSAPITALAVSPAGVALSSGGDVGGGSVAVNKAAAVPGAGSVAVAFPAVVAGGGISSPAG